MPDPSLVSVATQAANAYGIPPDLFIAQINQESSFNPNAQNGAASGIAQFMPGTAAQYGVNPYDPVSSLWGAAAYDADLYAKSHSWAKVLSNYGTIDPNGPSNQGQQDLLNMAVNLDSGGGGSSNPLFQTVSGKVPPAGGAATPQASGGLLSGIGAFITNWFVRGALILIGVVLIWQGLAMLRGSNVKENIEVVVKGAKRSTAKASAV